MFLEVPRRCYSASRASHLRLAVSSTRQLPERFSVRRPQEGQDTKQANRPISFGASTEPSSLLAAMMSLLVPTCKLTFPILTDLYTCASQSCNTAPHTKPRPVCHVSNISILPDPCWLQKKKSSSEKPGGGEGRKECELQSPEKQDSKYGFPFNCVPLNQLLNFSELISLFIK